jgi:hypothetical protein
MVYDFVTGDATLIVMISGDFMGRSCHLLPALKPDFCDEKYEDYHEVKTVAM